MLTLSTQLLHEAMEEVMSYCEFNKWLNEIHQFCKKWTDKSAREFKGEQAFTIEVRAFNYLALNPNLQSKNLVFKCH